MNPDLENVHTTMHPESTTVLWRDYPDPFSPYQFENELPFMIIKYILLVIEVLACILVISNNTLLVYAIAKFKRLQIRPNYFILNFSLITAALSLFCLLERLLELLNYPPIIFFVFVRTALYIFMQLAFILAALLGIDWFFVATFKDFGTRYQRVYKWVMALFYALPILTLVGAGTSAFQDILIFFVFIFSTYFSGLLVIIIINITKKCKSYDQESLRNSYALTVANIYYLMWLPIIATAVIYYCAFDYQETPAVTATMAFILELFNIISMIPPIVITFALIKSDSNFKIAYDLIFKRSFLAYGLADNDIEEENRIF